MKNEIITSEKDVLQKVELLALTISNDYKDREIDIICLINSASFFCADVARKITVPIRMHFLGFSSYSTANDSGEVKITHDIQEPLYNRHILIFEGIVVSGRTPKFIYEYLKLRKPASIEYCAVGIKPKSLSVDLSIRYHAFEFEPDQIVGGYGIGKGVEKSLPYLLSV